MKMNLKARLVSMMAVAACSTRGVPSDGGAPDATTTASDAAPSPDVISATDTTAGPTFPTASAWETVDPGAAGWDATALSAAFDFAGARATRAMVLLYKGRILAERYWDADSSYRRDIASAQKSVIAILVGEAVKRGQLSLDDTVTKHLGAGWSDAAAGLEAAILVRHLVTMTSGLFDDLTFEAAPGTVWRYNNDAYHQVQRVLEKATGTAIGPLTRSTLWDAIGIATSFWYQRPGMPDAKGNPMFGLSMTARDMARFGLLIAEDGRWNGHQILDEAYLRSALDSSQDLNLSYGYLWWLNGKATHRVPPRNELQPGSLIPDAPTDLVAALGKDDQKIYVSRSTGLVLTRLGDSAGPRTEALSSFDTELWAKIMAARR